MTDSQTILPKLSKATKTTSPSILAGTNFLHSYRASSLPNSPGRLKDQTGQTSASTFAYIEESPIGNASNLQISTFRDSKFGPHFSKISRASIDEKTMISIDRLIEHRQAVYKSPHCGTHRIVGKKDNNISKKETDHANLVAKINKFMEQKGIHAGYREKMFDKKFEVYQGVPTFVDVRSLLKESGGSRVSSMGAFDQEMNNISAIPKMRKSCTKEVLNTGQPRILQALKGNIDVQDSNIARNEATPVGVEHGLGLRRPYLQFKECSAVGLEPNMMGNTMRKRKYIGEKIGMKETVHDPQLVGSLIDHLTQKVEEEREHRQAIQEECENEFDKYMNREFEKEDYGGLLQRSSSMPLMVSEAPAEMKKEPEMMRLEALRDHNVSPFNKADPQIELFHRAQDYKERGREIIKALRTSLIQTHRKSGQKMSIEPSRFASCNSSALNDVLKQSHPSLSNNTPTFSKPDIVPSIILNDDNVTRRPVRTGSRLLRKPLKAKGSLKLPEKHSKNTCFLTNLEHGDKDKGGKILKMEVNEAHKMFLSRRGSSLKNLHVGDKQPLLELWNKLEDLTSTNKEISKQMVQTMRKFNQVYKQQKKTLNDLDVPEALREEKEKVKSSSRLAKSLAEKIIIAEKTNR